MGFYQIIYVLKLKLQLLFKSFLKLPEENQLRQKLRSKNIEIYLQICPGFFLCMYNLSHVENKVLFFVLQNI